MGHKVSLTHQVQECKPLVVHAQSAVLPEGNVPWEPSARALLRMRELGALEQGLVLGTHGGGYSTPPALS